VLSFDANTDTYTDFADCWIVELNGGALAVQRYQATRKDEQNGRLVFVVDMGSGSGGTTAAVSGTVRGVVVLTAEVSNQIMGTGMKTFESVAVARASAATNALDAGIYSDVITDRSYLLLTHQANAGAPSGYKEHHIEFRGGLTYWTPFLGAFTMSTVVPAALQGGKNLGWLATCPTSGRWILARYASTLTNNHAVYMEFNTGASYASPGVVETNSRVDIAANINAGGYLLLGGNLDTRGDTIFNNSTVNLVGFYGGAGVAQQTVTGTVTGGTLAQLQTAFKNLMAKLVALNLLADGTT
jgi:hypothetical protein